MPRRVYRIKQSHLTENRRLTSLIDRSDVNSCQICFDPFNDHTNCPHAFTCGHTTCKNCIIKLPTALIILQPFPIFAKVLVKCPFCDAFNFRVILRNKLLYPRINFTALQIHLALSPLATPERNQPPQIFPLTVEPDYPNAFLHFFESFGFNLRLRYLERYNPLSQRRSTDRIHQLEQFLNSERFATHVRLRSFLLRKLALLRMVLQKLEALPGAGLLFDSGRFVLICMRKVYECCFIFLFLFLSVCLSPLLLMPLGVTALFVSVFQSLFFVLGLLLVFLLGSRLRNLVNALDVDDRN